MPDASLGDTADTDDNPFAVPPTSGPAPAAEWTDTPLAGPATTTGAATLGKDIVTKVLDLDYLISNVRRTERTVNVCMRGDLADEYERLHNEIRELIADDGKPVSDGTNDEASLAEQTRADEIGARLPALREEMAEATQYVKFRALPEDEFHAFETRHRDKHNQMKDPADYWNRLIAACAVEPALSVEQVKVLRNNLSWAQMNALAVAALGVNTQGGLDVPKLPSYLPSPQRQDSSPN